MADFNILMQYIYEQVYSFFFKITLQSVTFFRFFKVSCLRQTNLQDSNLLTIHVDFCSQKGLIKSVEHKLFLLVQHGWSLNCSMQSNCSRQMLHSKIKTSAVAILNRCQTAETTPGGGLMSFGN
jgi:hypothetical protein